ncbi:hypothetical protein TBS_12120 [Thermobispora bispora]
MPAFTGAEPLARWRPDARPIQATVAQVCQAARLERAAAVVIDVAGPVPFVIEGEALGALARLEDAARGSASPEELAGAGVTVARIAEDPGPDDRPRRWWSRLIPGRSRRGRG